MYGTKPKEEQVEKSIVKLFQISESYTRNNYPWSQESIDIQEAFNNQAEVINKIHYNCYDGSGVKQKDAHALIHAATRGDLQLMLLALDMGVSANILCCDGVTALTAAALFKQTAAFELLSQNGANINACDRQGNTILMFATFHGIGDIIKHLVDLNVDINFVNYAGQTALMLAAYNGHPNILIFLWKQGALIDTKSVSGLTALMYACLKSRYAVIEVLLRNANICIEDNNNNTAVLISATIGDNKALKLMFKTKVDVNMTNKRGKTALMAAAEAGNFSTVKYLVESGAIVEKCMDSGESAIDLAIQSGKHHVVAYLKEGTTTSTTVGNDSFDIILSALIGDIDAIEFAIKCNVDVNTTDDFGRTPLMAASQAGHFMVTKCLIRNKADVNKTSNEGMTALAYSIQCKQEEITEYLIRKCADIELQDADERTLIMHFTKVENLEQVRYLCLLGSDIFHRDKEGKTALMMASELGFLEIVQFFVRQGCRKMSRCSKDLTAVDYAFINDRHDVHKWLLESDKEDESVRILNLVLLQNCRDKKADEVRKLLKTGAQVNCVENGNSPLTIASTEGSIDVVKTLVEYGATINYRNSNTGGTAMMYAVKNKHATIFNYLVKSGGSIHIPDRGGSTILMLAVSHKHADLCLYMLQRGAQCQKMNRMGATALATASITGCPIITKMLIHYGANINTPDKDGITPLQYAVLGGCLEIVKVLIQCGADMFHKNKLGQTAIDAAFSSKNKEVIKYIVAAAHSRSFRIIPKTNRPINELGPQLQNKILQKEDILKAYNFTVGKDKKVEPKQNITEEGNITPMEKQFLEICSMASLDREDAQGLIQKGVDINVKNEDGCTALLQAVKEKRPQIAEWMIRSKADVNCRDKHGTSALMYAAQLGDLRIVKLLLANNSDVNMTDNSGQTAIFHAIRYDKIIIIDILLRHRASIDYQDDEGATPLMLAVSTCTLDIIRLLIKFKPCVTTTDNIRRSVVWYCLERLSTDCEAVVRYLVDNGADIETVSEADDTPLLASVRTENVDMVKVLISLNANIEYMNPNGDNVWTVTIDNQSYLILQLLLQCRVNKDNIPLINIVQHAAYNADVKALDILRGCRTNWPESLTVLLVEAAIHQPNEELLNYLLQSRIIHTKNAFVVFSKVIGDNIQESEIIVELFLLIAELANNCYKQQNVIKASSKGFYETMTGIMKQVSIEDSGPSAMREQCLLIGNYDYTMGGHSSITRQWSGNTFNKFNSDGAAKIETDVKENGHKFENRGSKDSDRNMRLEDVYKAIGMKQVEKAALNATVSELEHRETAINETEQAYEEQLALLTRILMLMNDEMESLQRKKHNLLENKCELNEKADDMTKRTKTVTFACSTENESDDEDEHQDVKDIEGSSMARNRSSRSPYRKKPISQGDEVMYVKILTQPQFQGNSRHVRIMTDTNKGDAQFFLFKFHATVSQGSLDGRNSPSKACALIAMIFAYKYINDPLYIWTPPRHGIPEKIFEQVEEAIREGNHIYDINFDGKPKDLDPEDVLLLTSHLDVSFVEETDVDTRKPSTITGNVMNLKPNQAILFIKNKKVVSIFPCNNNEWVFLFDSHKHYTRVSYVTKIYGAYLFMAKKNESAIQDMLKLYEAYCDPVPFYGKFAMFNVTKHDTS